MSALDNSVCVCAWQEDLGYLKAVWDMIEKILGTFAEWYRTVWDKINVDQLLEQTRLLSKEVKGLNKAVRLYDVYRWAHPHLTIALLTRVQQLFSR